MEKCCWDISTNRISVYPDALLHEIALFLLLPLQLRAASVLQNSLRLSPLYVVKLNVWCRDYTKRM